MNISCAPLAPAALLILIGLCTCAWASPPVTEPASSMLRFQIDEAVSLPQPRGGHAAGMIGGQLVVVGGNGWTKDRTRKLWYSDTLILRQGHWVAGPALPHVLAYPAYCQVRDGMVLAGGMDDKSIRSDAFFLKSAGDSIEIRELPPLPIAVNASACGEVDGRVYVIGGETPKGMTDQVFMLDLAKPGGGWRSRAPLPSPARAFSATLFRGNQIFVLGGISSWSPMVVHDDVCQYDAGQDRWIKLPKLAVNGYAWSAAWVDSSHLLLAGRAYGQISDEIWAFSLPDMYGSMIGHCLTPTATQPLITMNKREWWVIGGEPDSLKTRTARITRIKLPSDAP